MTVRPVRSAWASESSLSAWRKFGSLATHWADAQADLSLPWAHSHLVGFVMSRLIYAEWASDKGPRDWNYWEAAGLLIAKSYSPFLKKRINCFIRLDFAGSDSSVGSEPAWYSGGCGFDSPVRQHSFAETGHEIISMAILPLLLIQREGFGCNTCRSLVSTSPLSTLFDRSWARCSCRNGKELFLLFYSICKYMRLVSGIDEYVTLTSFSPRIGHIGVFEIRAH